MTLDEFIKAIDRLKTLQMAEAMERRWREEVEAGTRSWEQTQTRVVCINAPPGPCVVQSNDL